MIGKEKSPAQVQVESMAEASAQAPPKAQPESSAVTPPQTPTETPGQAQPESPVVEVMNGKFDGMTKSAPVSPQEEKSVKSKWARAISATAPSKKTPKMDKMDMATLVLQYKRYEK